MIAIENKLPPLGKWVLAYLTDGLVGYFDVISLFAIQEGHVPYLVWTDGSSRIYEGVTHWMVLPEPPTPSIKSPKLMPNSGMRLGKTIGRKRR